MRLTLRERISGRVEERALPPAENQLPLLAAGIGTKVNTSTALKIADVWAAVRVLADAASSLPLHVYRRVEDGRERVTSGQLVDLLDRPAPGATQADLVSTLMSHILIWGNAYLGKYRRGGELIQVGLIDPDRIRPEIIGGELRYRYTPGTGPQQLLTERDVVHVKGLSVDGLVGLSAVSQAARVLGLSDELVQHALAYFSNTARPAGIVKLPAGTHTDNLERFFESWRARHEGTAKAHGIAFIEGDVEYQQVDAPMDDAQFVEQRRLAAQEIARVFRIPSHFLNAGTGGDSLTYSTAESMAIDFVRYSLTPWLRRIELAITHDRDLTSDRQFVKFEVDGLLRADARTRAEVYAKALDPVVGWMSRDEVRRLEDLPPEGDRGPSVEALLPRPPAPEIAVTNGGTDSE